MLRGKHLRIWAVLSSMSVCEWFSTLNNLVVLETYTVSDKERGEELWAIMLEEIGPSDLRLLL